MTKNQQGAPEALRLAEEWRLKTQREADRQNSAYDHYGMGNTPETVDPLGAKMASELRRLAALVEAQQPATHVQNPAEIEHVAGDVSKNSAKKNMNDYAELPEPDATTVGLGAVWNRHSMRDFADATHALRARQPAPATQQAPQQPCPTCAALARTVMLDQVSFDRKPDCYGIRQITEDEGVEEWEDIRTSPDVAREEANDMMVTGRGEIYEVVPLWTTPQPSPTPKADSQPAPDEVADAMADSQYLAGVSAGWNAANADDPNAALQKLHESRAGYLKPLSAARAPADSVTAPAGVAYLDIGAGGYIDLGTDLSNEALSRLPKGRHVLIIAGTYGIDGYTPIPPAQAADYDHGPQSETIQEAARHVGKWLNERPNRPLDLRDVAMLCAHAQAADSVLEDAARLDWLEIAGPTSICVVIDRPHDSEVEVSTDDVTGYGKTLREALDAAREQGGAT